jgi:hypothetical protein
MELGEALDLIRNRGESIRFRFPSRIVTDRHVYVSSPQPTWDRRVLWYTAHAV